MYTGLLRLLPAFITWLSVLVICPAPLHAGYDTRAFMLDGCPSDSKATGVESALGLAAAAVPALVDKAIGALATAIRKASEESTKVVAAERNRHFYRGTLNKSIFDGNFELAQDFGCIVLVHGRFDGDGKPEKHEHGDDETKNKALSYFRTNHHLSGLPKLYFEGAIYTSKDRTAFAVQPVLLHYPRKLGSGLSWFRKYESLLNVMFFPPSGEVEHKAFAVGIIRLENIIGKKWAKRSDMPERETRWMSYPAPSPEAKAAIAEIQASYSLLKTVDAEIADLAAILPGKAGDKEREIKDKVVVLQLKQARLTSQLSDLSEKYEKTLKLFLPYTLRVEMIETRKASKFLATVADILDGVKDPAKQAVAKAIDPGDPKAEAKLQEQVELAAVQARQAVELAELELLTVDRSDGKKLLAAQQTLVIRRLEANAAYRAASWPIPYPSPQP